MEKRGEEGMKIILSLVLNLHNKTKDLTEAKEQIHCDELMWRELSLSEESEHQFQVSF